MSAVTIERLSSALVAYAQPGKLPRDLLQSLQRDYPDATMKEVARAAYLAVLEVSDDDPERARALHDLATRARMSEN